MKKGFTLIELMVVIAIAAIMMGAVAGGFGSFFNTISVQNAPGQIGDILDQLGREAITRNYVKSSVFFKKDYLLVDSQTAGATLNLEWGTSPPCAPKLIWLKSDQYAWLFISDPSGDPLTEPRILKADEEYCINPTDYPEREVVNELRQNGDFSNKIRIFPLNLNLNSADDIEIADNVYHLDILQPYGKKERYKDDALLLESDSASIFIQSAESDAEVEYELPKS